MKGGSWATTENLTRPSFRNWSAARPQLVSWASLRNGAVVWHRYQRNYIYPFAKFRICRDVVAGRERMRFATLPGWGSASAADRFAGDVRVGLCSNPKRIDSVHFYDDRGSELEAIRSALLDPLAS